MIVLVALLIGIEYGYDTWKNLLIRRPGRAQFILSRRLALLVAAGAGVVVLLLLGQIIGLVLCQTPSPTSLNEKAHGHDACDRV